MLPPQVSPTAQLGFDGFFPSATLAPNRAAEVNANQVRLQPLLSAAERSLDFLTIVAAVYFAHVLHRALGVGNAAPYDTSSVLLSGAGFALLFVVLLERHGGYRLSLSLLGVRETERILRVTAESLLLALLVTYLTATPVSRTVVLFALVTVPVFLTLQKWETYRAICSLRGRGRGTRRAVILGAGPLGRRIYSALVRSPKFGLDPVAFVDGDPEKSGLEIYESSYQRKRAAKVQAGPVCPELLRQWDASVLVIAVPGLSRSSMIEIVAQLSAAGMSTYFVPQDLSGPGNWMDYDELDGVLLAHFSKERPRYLYEVAKRDLDLLLSALLLVLLAPLFAAIAVLVKVTSPGPVLFQQARVGKDGGLFSMYKFRTMFADAPQYAYSPRAGGDPRITPVGRFLRRTSLDELPQLLNVLRGDMSLVGPRPEMLFIVEQYTPVQRQRLSVKPGITGLWQLSADRAFLIHQNIEYDLYYVRHRSVWLDAAILLHTFLFAARDI